MNRRLLVLIVLAISILVMTGCSKVPPGNVGVKVYLLGGDKGIDQEILGVGRYWIGWNEELYLFPTYQQNYVWTKDKTEGSPTDESITFQTKEGLSINTDVGISLSVDPDHVSVLFQKYRKGIDEITRVYVRSMVRDAFVRLASSREVETVYGVGKAKLVEDVESSMREQLLPLGIILDRIFLVGDLRLPDVVLKAINAKIAATQQAQQRENELREAKAEAEKTIAKADGAASARLKEANAEAESNRLIQKSITPELIQYEIARRWDGKLPMYSGGGTPLIQLPSGK